MSTGISEIGSHPKDVERLKHHILWMLVPIMATGFNRVLFQYISIFCLLPDNARSASYVGAD